MHGMEYELSDIEQRCTEEILTGMWFLKSPITNLNCVQKKFIANYIGGMLVTIQFRIVCLPVSSLKN